MYIFLVIYYCLYLYAFLFMYIYIYFYTCLFILFGPWAWPLGPCSALLCSLCSPLSALLVQLCSAHLSICCYFIFVYYSFHPRFLCTMLQKRFERKSSKRVRFSKSDITSSLDPGSRDSRTGRYVYSTNIGIS